MSKTLDLNQAAKFLRMSPEALRQKAKRGEVPGAKPGKCWVFLEEDLKIYLRSKYTKQDIPPIAPPGIDAQYRELLGIGRGKKIQ